MIRLPVNRCSNYCYVKNKTPGLGLHIDIKQASSVKFNADDACSNFFRFYKICLLKTGMFYIELLSDV